tara:strand:+ start:478 stop:1101 length:624 start_codon:yes stop_codon:yes gene_type:complete
VVVVAIDWRWSSESKENLRVVSMLLVLLNDDVDDKVLSNTSNDWSKGLLQLPVNSIVEHVEQYYGLISDANVTVSLELDEQLFNPEKTVLVVCDLSNEQGSLDLFKIFHFLGCLSLSELCSIFLIHFLMEWELFDVDNDFGESGAQSNNSLHERELFGEDLNLLARRDREIWLFDFIKSGSALIIIFNIILAISLTFLGFLWSLLCA